MLTLEPSNKHRYGYSSDATSATDFADALAIWPVRVARTLAEGLGGDQAVPLSSPPDFTVL